MTTFFVSPEQAHVSHNTDAPVIAIKGFERGFYPIYTAATPEQLNKGRFSAEILEAAVIGSMFGWNVPGAKAAVDFIQAQEESQARSA